MSTNDVPGARPENHDVLAMGCWAEHEDGSLIFVEGTEQAKVIYSVFDMSKEPPFEYRDAMPETTFKRTYSWDPKGKKPTNEKWTWHDKTPFPWERIVQNFADGSRYPSAGHVATAAERIRQTRTRHEEESTAASRVADALHLEGRALDERRFEDRVERMFGRMEDIWSRIAGALDKLPGRKKQQRRAAGR